MLIPSAALQEIATISSAAYLTSLAIRLAA